MMGLFIYLFTYLFNHYPYMELYDNIIQNK